MPTASSDPMGLIGPVIIPGGPMDPNTPKQKPCPCTEPLPPSHGYSSCEHVDKKSGQKSLFDVA
jgi:hypothetical protein